MAKSRRSHTMKIKRRALSSRVFKPVEDARAERLSAKLLEIAQQPKPGRPQAMEVEEDKKENEDTWNGIDEDEKEPATEAMDIDESNRAIKRKAALKKKNFNIAKRKKPKNQLMFSKIRAAKGGGPGRNTKRVRT